MLELNRSILFLEPFKYILCSRSARLSCLEDSVANEAEPWNALHTRVPQTRVILVDITIVPDNGRATFHKKGFIHATARATPVSRKLDTDPRGFWFKKTLIYRAVGTEKRLKEHVVLEDYHPFGCYSLVDLVGLIGLIALIGLIGLTGLIHRHF